MEKVEQKAIIELKNVTKSYGSKTILKNLNLTINDGEFLTILALPVVVKQLRYV